MSTSQLDQFNFHHTLEAGSDIGIVFFSSEECSSCRHWASLLNELDADNQEINVYKVEAGSEPGLAQEFNVFHLPALFIYRDGNFHSDLQCEADLASIKKALDEALAAPAKESP